MTDLVLVGRSSSHFTRVARIFAGELGVAYALRVVPDLGALESEAYGGNPALKIPVLIDEEGALFGVENVVRAIVKRAGARSKVVLRGDVEARVVANAEELVVHAMSTVVSMVMATLAGAQPSAKLRKSLENAVQWLDEHVDAVVAALPPQRAISFVEAAIFSSYTHLVFREVLDVAPYARLGGFAARFGERASARATEYRFDAPT